MNYLNNTARKRYRSLNFLGLTSCAAALFFAIIYLQERLGFPPSPLAMTSRLLVLSIGVLFFLAWIQNPRQFGQRCYAVLGSLLCAIGIGLNLRHIWLQSLPAGQESECGTELEPLLQSLPLPEALLTILRGTGGCAEAHWTLVGLTLPQLTLLLLLFLLLIDIIQFRKKHRSYFK